MSSTIFCTFDQQDLADLAIGRLRAEFPGISHVSYSVGAGDNRSPYVNSASFGGFYVNGAVSTGLTPSRPATVRITCDDSVRKQVASRLVNLHGYRIVNA